jgi:hypothetical protein
MAPSSGAGERASRSASTHRHPTDRSDGQTYYTHGAVTSLESTEGTVTFRRPARTKVYLNVKTPADSVRSNTETIAARPD